MKRLSFNACCWLLTLLSCLAEAPIPSERGIQLLPITDKPATGSAGLFVGINDFRDESLVDLQMAVNDAVAQANLFVFELGLIEPGRCTLALSGEPTSAEVRTNLEALLSAGVRRTTAEKNTLLQELARAVGQGHGPQDLLVISFSTHGFDEERVGYLMPSDGLRADLAETTLRLTTIGSKIERSKAGKRLLLTDACRERVETQQKGIGTGMTSAFWEAFHNSRGQGALTSCDVGQVSLENPALGHGVFTYYLLEALRGKAATDLRGFITLETACRYVDEQIQVWYNQNRPGADPSRAQHTRFEGPNQLRTLPLALSRAVAEEQKKFAQERTALLQQLPTKINRSGQFNAAMFERVAETLENAEADDAGRELLQNVQAFARGETKEALFVAWVEKTLQAHQPKPKEPPYQQPLAETNLALGERSLKLPPAVLVTWSDRLMLDQRRAHLSSIVSRLDAALDLGLKRDGKIQVLPSYAPGGRQTSQTQRLRSQASSNDNLYRPYTIEIMTLELQDSIKTPQAPSASRIFKFRINGTELGSNPQVEPHTELKVQWRILHDNKQIGSVRFAANEAKGAPFNLTRNTRTPPSNQQYDSYAVRNQLFPWQSAAEAVGNSLSQEAMQLIAESEKQ